MAQRRTPSRGADRLTNDNSNADPAEIVAGGGGDLFAIFADQLPAWRRDAACIGESVDTFYPRRGQSSAPAYELCGRCPVRTDCLAEALADSDLDHGIRGGMSAQARKQRRRLDAKRAKQ